MTAFSFNESHDQLREMIRRFLDEKAPIPMARAHFETEQGFDRDVWQQLGSQLGLIGICVPERLGGSGGDAVDLAIILEEMGRSLYSGPFLGTACLALPLLLAIEDGSDSTALVSKIVGGERLVSAAIAENDGWKDHGFTTSAFEENGSWTASGTKLYVFDAAAADEFLVAATDANGVGVLLAVDRAALGVTVETQPSLDLTRRVAMVKFNRSPARLLSSGDVARSGIARSLQMANFGVACEAVGGGAAALNMAVEYAKTRTAFGRRIGSFQALKHRCANMLLDVESAKAACYASAWAMMDDPDDFLRLLYLAKSYCSEAFFRVATDNIQVHGGIGYTWEHNAHLYYRRAKSSEILFTTARDSRDQMLVEMGI